MFRVFLPFLCALFLSHAALAEGLPPIHEVARLNIAIEKSVASEDWLAASKLVEQMRQLQVSQPLNSYYFEGLILAQLGQPDASRKVLERYVVQGGSGATYYKQALELITDAMARQSADSRAVEPSPKVSLIEEAQSKRSGYVKSLQALFMVESEVEALVMQINSLLSAHPFTGERLRTAKMRQGQVFKVSTSGSELLLQEKRYDKGVPTLKVEKINMLGLNPFISFDCSKSDYACWLLNPATESGRWIVFDYDEIVANELSNAMSHLIQALQNN